MKEKLFHWTGRVLIAGFLLLFLVIPFTVLLLLRTGWPPVAGNLISARALRQYAAQAHPDWTPSGHWAGYNPISGAHYLYFSSGDETYSLSYDLAGGAIRDEAREAELTERLGLEETIRSFRDWELPASSLVSLSMHWSVQEWEQPQVRLSVSLRDAPDQPLPEQDAIRERMATRAAEVFDALSPRIPIQNLLVFYSCWAVQDQNGSPLSYRAAASAPEGRCLSRSEVRSAALSAEAV